MATVDHGANKRSAPEVRRLCPRGTEPGIGAEGGAFGVYSGVADSKQKDWPAAPDVQVNPCGKTRKAKRRETTLSAFGVNSSVDLSSRFLKELPERDSNLQQTG